MLGILLVVRYVISWEEITRSRILEWIERLDNGSVVGGRQRIKVGIFKDMGDDFFFEIGRDGAGESEPQMI